MLKSDLDFGLVRALVKEQFSRLWGEISTQRLKVEERAAASLIGKTLEALKQVDLDLCDVAWTVLATNVKISSGTGKVEDARLVSALLRVLVDGFNSRTADNGVNSLKERAEGLLRDVLLEDVGRCEGLVRGSVEGKEVNFALLVNLLEQFREVLFLDEVFASVSWFSFALTTHLSFLSLQKLDNLLSEHAFRFLSMSPVLLLSYLTHRKDEPTCLFVWHSLLSSIASSDSPDSTSIKSLLNAAQKGTLPKYLEPQQAELDHVVKLMLERALAGPMDSDEASLLEQILESSSWPISSVCSYSNSPIFFARILFVALWIRHITSNYYQELCVQR